MKAAKEDISIKSMFKNFKNAKGVGKVVPGFNILAKSVDVFDSINSSEKLAKKSKLKGIWHKLSVGGGVGIDLAESAVVAGASDLAANVVGGLTVAGLATIGITSTPVWVTGAVLGAAYVTSKALNYSKFSEKLRKDWNNFFSKGMKYFS